MATADADDELDGDIELGEGAEDEESEEEDDQANYGVDQEAQEEWSALCQTHTLHSLFMGSTAVVQNTSTAADDLQQHVQNILTSLDLFPMIYAKQIEVLDREGKGKDLRQFITLMQRAMGRCQRISSAIFTLCTWSEEFTNGLKSLVGARALQWHLQSLRVAGQHDILLRLQRNQLEKLRLEYTDVLDLYGEQCEATGELERKVSSLELDVQRLRNEVETSTAAMAASKASPLEGDESKALGFVEILQSFPDVGMKNECKAPSLVPCESKSDTLALAEDTLQKLAPSDDISGGQIHQGIVQKAGEGETDKEEHSPPRPLIPHEVAGKGVLAKGKYIPPLPGSVQSADDAASEVLALRGISNEEVASKGVPGKGKYIPPLPGSAQSAGDRGSEAAALSEKCVEELGGKGVPAKGKYIPPVPGSAQSDGYAASEVQALPETCSEKSGKGLPAKGKYIPPLPGSAQSAGEAASEVLAFQNTDKEVSGKGLPTKGKYIPPLPGSAQSAGVDASEAPSLPGTCNEEIIGKGMPAKGKYVPPPPGSAQWAVDTGEREVPEGSVAKESQAPLGKGTAVKGKQVPPPPGKGQSGFYWDEAPLAQGPSGKGKPAPPPCGKGQSAGDVAEKSAGKGPPLPNGKGPAPPSGKGGAPLPPGKGGKEGAPSGKDGKGGKKGKEVIPKPAPGPAPPKDLAPKKFQWTKVLDSRFSTSIFAKIVESLARLEPSQTKEDVAAPTEPLSLVLKVPDQSKLFVDLGSLTKHFFAPKVAPVETAATTTKVAVAKCLDGKRAQNVEIFLNACNVTIDQVKSCVLDLNEKDLHPERLAKLIELYPTSDELPTLETFQAENDPNVLPWGRAEQFLISLMEIPNFLLRAECCVAKRSFPDEFENLSKDIALFKECLTLITKSSAIPAVFAMIVQIGNYLNYGNKWGQQGGFTLDTLSLLTRVEAFSDKTFSLMRFIMESLESDRTVRDQAFDDIKLCDACSKLDWTEVTRQVSELDKKVSKVSASVMPCRVGEGDVKLGKIGDAPFESALRIFATSAQRQLVGLRTQADEVTQLCKDCLDVYGEKKDTPMAEVFGKLAQFRKDMEDARRNNLLARGKKEKAERRAAEKAAKKAAQVESGCMVAQTAATSDPAVAGSDAIENPAPGNTSKSPMSQLLQPPQPQHMRHMKMKEPERPVLAHALLPGRRLAGDMTEVTRMTLGPGSRPRLALENIENSRPTLGSASAGRNWLPLTPVGQGLTPRGHLSPRGLHRSSNEPSGPGVARNTIGPSSRQELLKVSGSGRISVGPQAAAALRAKHCTSAAVTSETASGSRRG